MHRFPFIANIDQDHRKLEGREGPPLTVFGKLVNPISIQPDCAHNTLAKTEIIYPKNVGASVAMNFT